MSRYIDADKINAKLMNEYHGMISDESMKIYKIIQILDNAPTSDVQEVRHGKMNIYKPRSRNRNATYKCSVCGKLCSSYYNDVGEWKFCPHCGAKMDGDDETNI